MNFNNTDNNVAKKNDQSNLKIQKVLSKLLSFYYRFFLKIYNLLDLGIFKVLVYLSLKLALCFIFL